MSTNLKSKTSASVSSRLSLSYSLAWVEKIIEVQCFFYVFVHHFNLEMAIGKLWQLISCHTCQHAIRTETANFLPVYPQYFTSHFTCSSHCLVLRKLDMSSRGRAARRQTQNPGDPSSSPGSFVSTFCSRNFLVLLLCMLTFRVRFRIKSNLQI